MSINIRQADVAKLVDARDLKSLDLRSYGFDLPSSAPMVARRAAELVDIIKRDRAWNDDGARKQLLQFFDAWGAIDPATISARRKLSALLFS